MANTGTDLAAEWVKPSDLVPWPGNPRVNDHVVDKVAASIARFGFGAPIVARRSNNEVIKGHTRLKAALKLELEKVPVRFLDISEKEAHALALADNKLGELADWSEGLSGVMGGFERVELADLGWDEHELDAFLKEPTPPTPPSEFPEFTDSIKTDYCCPKCNYEWSGKPK